MGNNKKLPIQKFSKKVIVDRKERGLPLPIQFRAETFEWVMVMVDRNGKGRGFPLPIQFRAETFEWLMVMVDRKHRPY